MQSTRNQPAISMQSACNQVWRSLVPGCDEGGLEMSATSRGSAPCWALCSWLARWSAARVASSVHAEVRFSGRVLRSSIESNGSSTAASVISVCTVGLPRATSASARAATCRSDGSTAISLQSACNQHTISMQSGRHLPQRRVDRNQPAISMQSACNQAATCRSDGSTAISMQSACNQHAIRPPPAAATGRPPPHPVHAPRWAQSSVRAAR